MKNDTDAKKLNMSNTLVVQRWLEGTQCERLKPYIEGIAGRRFFAFILGKITYSQMMHEAYRVSQLFRPYEGCEERFVKDDRKAKQAAEMFERLAMGEDLCTVLVSNETNLDQFVHYVGNAYQEFFPTSDDRLSSKERSEVKAGNPVSAGVRHGYSSYLLGVSSVGARGIAESVLPLALQQAVDIDIRLAFQPY